MSQASHSQRHKPRSCHFNRLQEVGAVGRERSSAGDSPPQPPALGGLAGEGRAEGWFPSLQAQDRVQDCRVLGKLYPRS